jgi:hypothetical protein
MQEADRSRAQCLRLNRIVRVGGYENDWYVKAQMCAVSAPMPVTLRRSGAQLPIFWPASVIS